MTRLEYFIMSSRKKKKTEGSWTYPRPRVAESSFFFCSVSAANLPIAVFLEKKNNMNMTIEEKE